VSGKHEQAIELLIEQPESRGRGGRAAWSSPRYARSAKRLPRTRRVFNRAVRRQQSTAGLSSILMRGMGARRAADPPARRDGISPACCAPTRANSGERRGHIV